MSTKPVKPAPASVARARSLIAAAGPIPDGCPALTWRSGLIEAARQLDPRPEAKLPLGWLPASALATIPGACPAPEAAGAIVAPLTPLAAWLRGEARQAPAVQLLTVAQDGRPIEDHGGLAKRTYGAATGCCWCWLPDGPGSADQARVGEGVADALALSVAYGPACAALTCSALPALAEAADTLGVDLVIHAADDGAGREAAKLARRLARHIVVDVRLHAPGSDPAAAFEAAASPERPRSARDPRPREAIRLRSASAGNDSGPSPAPDAGFDDAAWAAGL